MPNTRVVQDAVAIGSPLASVIIPLHRDNETFRTCLSACLALDYQRIEVIVVSDSGVNLPDGVRLVLTNAERGTGPGEKRDAGIQEAHGNYLAFLDDDAAPRHDWLSNAIRIFQDVEVGAVAGPGVTPPGSSWRERVGGAFYESWLGSGPYRYRFRPSARRKVDDYPAYNLILRRTAAEHVNGWGTGFYGGEDTVICLALVRSGWKIIYEPSVVVYHRRRPILRRHLAQIGNVGLHRGYFVKRYPQTSLRLSYFLPALGTIALIAMMALAPFNTYVRAVLMIALGVCALVGFAFGFAEQRDPTIAVALPLVVLLSHIAYAVQFVRGLLAHKLDR